MIPPSKNRDTWKPKRNSYALHDGYNKNLILKPCWCFAFRSPYESNKMKKIKIFFIQRENKKANSSMADLNSIYSDKC